MVAPVELSGTFQKTCNSCGLHLDSTLACLGNFETTSARVVDRGVCGLVLCNYNSSTVWMVAEHPVEIATETVGQILW